jgi:protein TorT
LDAPTREWKICTSIPHLKDAYWLGVNYGLVDEAKRLNVTLGIFEAGGYGNLDTQIKQIEDCLADGSDALIVSAIDFDKLNPALEQAHSKGVPVIDLINGVSFPQVAAKSLGDFYDNGFAVGRYLVERHEDSSHPVTVLWFPGPKGAGWVHRGEKGFNDALEGSNIEILVTSYGDTGKKAQGELVEEALDAHPNVDYIVGTAVTAEAAVDIVRRKGLKGRSGILAYYFGPGVYRGIKRGTIIAAPSDLPAIQARIALDQAVRILEGKPYLKHVGPEVGVIDRESLKDFDLSTTLPPKGFKATFDVN